MATYENTKAKSKRFKKALVIKKQRYFYHMQLHEA